VRDCGHVRVFTTPNPPFTTRSSAGH
jgi:hypothetical protein